MKKYFIIILAAIAGLLSCEKQNLGNPAQEARVNPDEIVFRSDIPVTRATGTSETTTANLSAFNVIAATASGATETAVWTDGAYSKYTVGNEEFFHHAAGGKWWPSEAVSYNFYAANADMTFNGAGTTIAVANCAKDVVAEYVTGVANGTVQHLVFDHILCQLGTVKMKAPEGFTVTGLKVSIKPIEAGTYNMKTNAWTRGSESVDVYIVGTAAAGVDVPTATNTYQSGDNDLWLLPGTYVLTASYTISKGDFSKSYTKSATVSLEQGKNNNLGLPGVNHDEPNIPGPGDDLKEIIFSVTVTPWSDVEVPANFS